MKHIKVLLLITFLSLTNSLIAQTINDKWPAIKEFHEVMSQTFHPAEEGNFTPIKARSEEMWQKASLLLKSDIPQEFRTNSIMDSAEKLQVQSKNLNDLVIANVSDEIIMKSLSDLHNTFHDIMGLCSSDKN